MWYLNWSDVIPYNMLSAYILHQTQKKNEQNLTKIIYECHKCENACYRR